MAHISSNKCGKCTLKNNTVLYCYECEHFLCQGCRTLHDKFARDHTTVEVKNEGRRVFKSNPVCSEHQSYYIYYCKDCSCLTCKQCITSSHNRHSIGEIKGAAKDYCEKIKTEIKTLETKIKTTEEMIIETNSKNLKQIESKSGDVLKKLQAVGGEIHAIIDRLTKINTTTVYDFKQLENQQQAETIEMLDKLRNVYMTTCSELQNLIVEKHDVIFISDQQTLKKKIEDLGNPPELIVPKHLGVIDEVGFTKSIIDEIEKTILKRAQEASRPCENCQKLESEVSSLKTQIADLQRQFNEAVGDILRDNNPNIADRSDMNRPTSLAENFSSLYTDEYTDAMEVIEESVDESECVRVMLSWLKSCYDWCERLATEQKDMLTTETIGFMSKYHGQKMDMVLSDRCLIFVQEFQEKIAAVSLRIAGKICNIKSVREENLLNNNYIKQYIKKSSELCWMMQISDPPL